MNQKKWSYRIVTSIGGKYKIEYNFNNHGSPWIDLTFPTDLEHCLNKIK